MHERELNKDKLSIKQRQKTETCIQIHRHRDKKHTIKETKKQTIKEMKGQIDTQRARIFCVIYVSPNVQSGPNV